MGSADVGKSEAAMNADLLAEAMKLSPSDRLELIEALWDTLSEEDVPVTPAYGSSAVKKRCSERSEARDQMSKDFTMHAKPGADCDRAWRENRFGFLGLRRPALERTRSLATALLMSPRDWDSCQHRGG